LNIPWRKIHRWLGLLVGFQVVAWMLSGLYFALVPIEEIRGEHLTRPALAITSEEISSVREPAVILQEAMALIGDAEIKKLELRKLRNSIVYRLEYAEGAGQQSRLFAADTGLLLPMLEPGEAGMIAQNATRDVIGITVVELVSEHTAGSEYRGRSLPLYRVNTDSENGLRLYIDSWTGEVVARRTGQWRLFDLLWSLHIMDFQDRDNFNHPLLIVFAAAALVLSVGGYILWWVSSVFMQRRGAGRLADLHYAKVASWATGFNHSPTFILITWTSTKMRPAGGCILSVHWA